MSVADRTVVSVEPSMRSGSGVFRAAVALAIAWGVAVLMWATTRTLLQEWSDTANLTYTHGYLVVAVSAWTIVRSHQQLANVQWAPQFWLVAILLAVSIAWLVSYQAGLLVVHQALLPIAMWLAIYAICGWRIARLCAFGVGYLYFAVPIWSLLNSGLQGATTSAMKALLPLVGVPTYFSGNTVYIPSGVFEIAGGCSGLHYFIVGLALAALYGEMHRDTLKTRFLLLVVAAVLAVLANWIRVFTIIVAGHLTEMQHFLVRVDHYYFGWFVFALTMGAFLYWASRLPQSATTAAHDSSPNPTAKGRIWLATLLAAAAVALGPLRVAQARPGGMDAPELLPVMSHEWSGPQSKPVDWQPKFSRADAQAFGTYVAGERRVEVFVAYYREQRQGKELTSSGNSVVGEANTSRSSRKRIENAFGERIIEARDGTRWLLWDRYRVGSRDFYSPLRGQLWYGAASLHTVLPSTVLALRSECVPDCEAAREINQAFVSASRLGGSTWPEAAQEKTSR